MNKTVKIIIVVVLVTVVSAAIALKQKKKTMAGEIDSTSQVLENPKSTETAVKLPRLVDLGAGKCIPCKMMAPILEQLQEEYKGRLDVIFIDVWENPDEAKKYDIKIIPTQIFYNAGGKELFRHEGFFSKEDILAKWKELGIGF